jgi:hypothetical protein
MHISSTAPATPTQFASAGKSKDVPPGLSGRGGLPPGIAKKLEAGGTPPPGILKRFPAAAPTPAAIPPVPENTSNDGTQTSDGGTALTTPSVDLLA